MTERRLQLALAAVFLIVGILATANTIRFNQYVKETLPRDQAQEQCNTETLNVLKSWLEARVHRDGAMDARDEATVVVLDRILDERKATEVEVRAWRDAVIADRQVRGDVRDTLESHPLPDC